MLRIYCCRCTPRLWCNEFAAFVTKSQIVARSFLMDQHALWHSPRLLSLPTEYEKIFTVSTNNFFETFIIFTKPETLHQFVDEVKN